MSRPRLVGLLTGVVLAGLAACTVGGDIGEDVGGEQDPREGSDDAAIGGPPPAEQSAPEASQVREPVVVERVIDGDSLELSIGGEQVEVRLLGVNAPELRTLGGESSCPGARARAELQALVDEAGSLSFEMGGTDRFGRLLGVVAVEGRPVTEAMVVSGWALALWSAEDPLVDSMREAAADRRGMWGDGCGEPAARELVISDHRADAPGDDRQNLNEEWVEVTNTGAAAVDLDGWTIRDETTSNRFAIADLVLDPGSSVRFRSGMGPSDADDYYLGEEFPVWSNRGDTALLVDPAGVIAAVAFLAG